MIILKLQLSERGISVKVKTQQQKFTTEMNNSTLERPIAKGLIYR